jgi:hypothetical protein
MFEAKRDDDQAELQRRLFVKYLGLSFVGFGLLNACSLKDEGNVSMGDISRQDQFQLFWTVLFPAQELGLDQYLEESLDRVLRLRGEKADTVISVYHLFKEQLWINGWYGLKGQDSPSDGAAAIADILRSDHVDEVNRALDIIYGELRKVKGLAHEMWGRPYSGYEKKCLYWESYDQPVV